MKKHLIHITALLIVGLLTACNDRLQWGDDYKPSQNAHYLSLSNSSFTMGAASNLEQNVKVTSIGSEWKFDGYDSWLSLTPSKGNSDQTVSILATENHSATQIRTSVFQFQSVDIDYIFSRPLSVTQQKATPFLVADEGNLVFSAASEVKNIHVSTNIIWSASSDQDWIVLRPSTDTNMLQIEVLENLSDNSRLGKVYLNSASEGINISFSISVVQSAASTPQTDLNTLTFSCSGSAYLLNINSEVAWTAQTSESWIQITPSKGNAGISTIVVETAPNNSTNLRTGVITFYIGNTERLAINVTQEGMYVKLAPTSLTFTAEAQEQKISLSSNIAWEIVNKPDWLTISPSSGDGDATLSLIVPDYWETVERNGILTLAAKNNSEAYSSVTITQVGRSVGNIISELYINVDGGESSVNINTNGRWNANTDVDWLSLSPKEGVGASILTVKCQPNATDNERNAQIFVVIGAITKIISVKQPGRYFTVSPVEGASIPSTGGSHEVNISSNGSWKAISSSAWMQLSRTNGEGDINVVLTASDNASVHERTDTTTFIPDYLQPIRIITKQLGRYLKVNTSAIRFFSKGGPSEPIIIDTDGNYEITSSVDWMTIQQNGNTFTVTATENNGKDDREGVVNVALTDLKDGESYSISIPVKQKNFSAGVGIEDFESEQSWDVIYKSGMTITVTGFLEETNWDIMPGENMTITITDFNEEENWNN